MRHDTPLGAAELTKRDFWTVGRAVAWPRMAPGFMTASAAQIAAATAMTGKVGWESREKGFDLVGSGKKTKLGIASQPP